MFADVRLIALSGYGQIEDKRRSKDAGFDDFLVKPVEPIVLAALFDTLTISASRAGRPNGGRTTDKTA